MLFSRVKRMLAQKRQIYNPLQLLCCNTRLDLNAQYDQVGLIGYIAICPTCKRQWWLEEMGILMEANRNDSQEREPNILNFAITEELANR